MQCRHLRISAIVVAVIFLCSCNRLKPQKPSNREDADTVKQSLIAYNKLCIEDEKLEIKAFTDSVNANEDIKFTESENGYWYRDLSHGDAKLPAVKDGSTVTIAYSIELIDGTICYQSLNGVTKKFVAGRRDETKGLDMAVIGKKAGDETELILPYNLAYGVAGDRDCIPPRTPVIYKFKIIDVE